MGSLVHAGLRIRLTGVKSEDGPFDDRHLVLRDVASNATYVPLQSLSSRQPSVDVLNTRQDEIAAFSLEYAYSLGFLDGLLIWEARSEEFAKQWEDIIHRLIRRGHAEWGQRSSMVVLLPQSPGKGGFSGPGPWPRNWIQLIAQNHIQVCMPAMPDQYFHLLRRQALTQPLKPLVVILPERGVSLHPQNLSDIEDLANGRFNPILPDRNVARDRVERILLCSGKTYYDLDKKRVEERKHDVAILRLQQIYPLSSETIAEALAAYPNEAEVVWVQEEAEDAGVWPYLSLQLGVHLHGKRGFSAVFRAHSTNPGGSREKEKIGRSDFLEAALMGCNGSTRELAPTWEINPRREIPPLGIGSLQAVDSDRVGGALQQQAASPGTSKLHKGFE